VLLRVSHTHTHTHTHAFPLFAVLLPGGVIDVGVDELGVGVCRALEHVQQEIDDLKEEVRCACRQTPCPYGGV
jgi:hypothetical protein